MKSCIKNSNGRMQLIIYDRIRHRIPHCGTYQVFSSNHKVSFEGMIFSFWRIVFRFYYQFKILLWNVNKFLLFETAISPVVLNVRYFQIVWFMYFELFSFKNALWKLPCFILMIMSSNTFPLKLLRNNLPTSLVS